MTYDSRQHWDAQRIITQVTTLALEEDGSRLCLHQVAEKDQVQNCFCEFGSMIDDFDHC